MIAILDYDAGNIKSVEKAFGAIGQETVFTRDFREIEKADKVVLPGVGSFGSAMNQLHKYHLHKATTEEVDSDKPFLGICLGLQLLFESSDESPEVDGLGILRGQVKRIPDTYGLKIPHIGWNSLDLSGDGRLFKGLESNPYVYFVHSYYLQAHDADIVKATSEYGVKIHASVESGNVFACQFHPEKSSDTGLKILQNFAELN